MVTKQYKGYIGYGNSEKEATDSLIIISVLNDAYNIRGFEGLESKRQSLAPWSPKHNTLHIKNVGYLQILYNDNKPFIKLSNEDEIAEFEVKDNLFETLYNCFYDKLSMVDIALCSTEIDTFFKGNNIVFPSLSSYPQVLPLISEIENEYIVSNVITDKYTICFYKDNKVAIKSNIEDYFWTAECDSLSVKELIYYIAYVKKYKDILKILKE